MTTTCDRCGYVVKRGLASHQRGLRCDGLARARRLRALGYVRIDQDRDLKALRAVLKGAHLLRNEKTDYRPGGISNPARLVISTWAPAWAVAVIRLVGPETLAEPGLADLTPIERLRTFLPPSEEVSHVG